MKTMLCVPTQNRDVATVRDAMKDSSLLVT